MHWRGRVGTVATAAVLVAVVAAGSPDASAQEPGGEETPETQPGSDLVVPGESVVTTTETTAPEAPGPTDAVTAEDDDDPLATSTLVWLVITGLLVVAAMIGVLTFLFWRNTHPERRLPPDDSAAVEYLSAQEVAGGGHEPGTWPHGEPPPVRPTVPLPQRRVAPQETPESQSQQPTPGGRPSSQATRRTGPAG